MKSTLRVTMAAVLLAAGLAACKSETPKTSNKIPPAPELPGAGAPVAPPGAIHGLEQPAGKMIVGTVLETMNSGGYTYVHVESGTEKIWAAAPEFSVKKGEKVTVPEGMPMQNYHSSTLNRDFPLIYFVGAIGVGDKAPAGLPAAPPSALMAPGAEAGAPMAEGMHPKIDASQAAKDAKVDLKGIKKAEKTIAEIFGAQASLSGKEVAVRGKIVKYNPMVMGKNWIHIQDGSGQAGSNDLTVTTQDAAKVGDTVIVKGVIATNRDFGMGYKYNVIIEDAKVSVE